MSKYEWGKLSPEELDKRAEKQPWLALKYASHRLTPERRAWIIRKYPAEALEIMAKDKHLMEESDVQG